MDVHAVIMESERNWSMTKTVDRKALEVHVTPLDELLIENHRMKGVFDHGRHSLHNA